MPKVLLVEDDNNLREIYQARLLAEGYDIVAAQNGEEALVVAKQNKPDLIISDVMMPRISGFEMLDILRNTDELKHTKIIMLTALGQAEDQKRADNLGADRYLVKSQVTLEDIVNAAKELLVEDGSLPADPAPEQVAPPAPAAEPAAAPPTVQTPIATEPSVAAAPAPEPVVAPTAPTPEPVAAAPVTPTIASSPEPVAAPVTAAAPTPQPVVQAPSMSAAPAPQVTPAPTAAPVQTPAPTPTPQAVNTQPAPELLSTPQVVAAPAVQPPVPEATDPMSEAAPAPTEPSVAAAPAPEPVAAPTAPTPEPAAAAPTPTQPQSASPADPIATDSAQAAVQDASAQTLQDEEAALQAQIASYANSPDEVTPAPVLTQPANAAEANAEAIEDAVAELNQPTPQAPLQPPSVVNSAPTEPSVAAAPAPEPVAAPTAPTPEPAAAAPVNDSTPQSVAGKKVIQPLTNPADKPSLDELVAREDAKQITPAAPVVNGTTQPVQTPPAATPGQSFDPNTAL